MGHRAVGATQGQLLMDPGHEPRAARIGHYM